MTPTFSVIVAAHNAERTIASSLRSALAQTRPDFEVIVVDDGSTDATAERVREFTGDERVRLVRQPNGGASAARNTGLAHSRGRYVGALDADDLYLPNFLDVHAAALERDETLGFVWGDSWVIVDSPRCIRRRVGGGGSVPEPFPQSPPELLRALLRVNFVNGNAMMRRSALEQAGGWNEGLQASVDYELWLRIVAGGYRAAYIPGAFALWRLHSSSLTRSAARMYESRREVARVVAEEWEGVDDDAKAIAREEYARYQRLAVRARDEGSVAVARRAARRFAGRVKRRVLRSRLYYDTPPSEITAVYPDLSEL